jgi:hypothetical protein
MKGSREPASIIALRTIPFALFATASVGITLYAKAVKRYNVLWYVGGLAPLASFALYNYWRQPA